ncbi:bifunctional acetate--CoA ligase family protein/GNAT family N-acetyltransferase [Roseospira navarrensis]|uniref:GNAT family N-acetyltransferase n=1 Tax=Roseospira navarrensis TaxID=140058 RepID=A0A7X1ZAW2_9PROT|nr:bifunctional acetate--CoA ligase family protein/GNAT family N-acetyltransferase [Roseospira navarrensis]MQX35186.1 GNAT family N-acetyltransferase [Roseospira navarrensis]
MSTHNLDKLFAPTSVTVIGASNRPHTVGNLIMRNLLQGGFEGPIMPVHPKSQAVTGVLAYPTVEDLPIVPDMAVVVVPPAAVPGVIDSLGRKGVKAAIVITAGLGQVVDEQGVTAQARMVEIARRYSMRLLGPNCVGLLVPGVNLNASFLHEPARPGKVAFVSQSGALCTAVMDWASPRGIGFSHFISLGDNLDVDFGDTIDYLGTHPDVRAILLYIEAVRDARKFLSAARAASRNKPVLAIKAGRVAEGAKAAASHTGALAGADHIYDAAFRRAGVLRVYNLEELFEAVETVAHQRRLVGERLAIMTNGGGIGVMAVDDLIDMGGSLATLSDDTVEKLNKVLPPTWSKANPIDIIGDAPGKRYTDSMEILFQAPEVDSVLVMHAPTAISSPDEIAGKVIDLYNKNKKAHVTTCFVGEGAVANARRMFAHAHIPSYETPDQAVRAFMHTVTFARNRKMLMETPPSLPVEFTPAATTARLIIEASMSRGSMIMNEPDAKAVFSAYGIPTVETHIARGPDEAAEIADRMGCSVAVKILSPDITHKSDVGGVVLNLNTPEETRQAAQNILDRVGQVYPDARIDGFTVQKMMRRPGAHELIIGVATDAVFGLVILFGEGGTAVEVIADRAVTLPPLNMNLARNLIENTRIYKRLQGYRDRPAADLESICLTLIKVSQLVIDVPEIVELDINPLFADSQGVLAVDARIKLDPSPQASAQRMAIRPYPKTLEEWFTMTDGRSVLLRPIRPEDEPKHYEFVSRLTPEDIRFRFFGLVKELPHDQMARLTQIDYAREMAFIARADLDKDGEEETLGVVRTVTDADNQRTEFSIVVRSDLKGSGLGLALLEKMIRYARDRGTTTMIGQVLKDNTRMLHFCENLGFKRARMVEEDVVELELDLQHTGDKAPA